MANRMPVQRKKDNRPRILAVLTILFLALAIIFFIAAFVTTIGAEFKAEPARENIYSQTSAVPAESSEENPAEAEAPGEEASTSDPAEESSAEESSVTGE